MSAQKICSQVNMGIQSTAGAVRVRNEKGELYMQKVKVHRYVSGKRPDYAPKSSSDEESDDDDFIEHQPRQLNSVQRVKLSPEHESEDEEKHGENDEEDPRLKRLEKTKVKERVEPVEDYEEEDRGTRHRHIEEEKVIEEPGGNKEESSTDEEDLSDEEIEKRRKSLKQKLLAKKETVEVEVLGKEEDNRSDKGSDDESSEYEEYSDSEEDSGPLLKPVFVRKRDRITTAEKDKETQRQKQIEFDAKKMADERRRQTLKMVEDEIRKAAAKEKSEALNQLNDVNTDDDNDEVDYEQWKLRELKRVKRDREEREQLERERYEVERLRNMTEEERRIEFRNYPKLITNKMTKGKYKFLQKYYHRGAFYLDEEQDVLKRNFSLATLEDHFDKTILPKVMQVKNFGRSGRTKYTHLMDQDTTQFDSPWATDTSQNLKFVNNQAAGLKQVFEKPTKKHQKRSK